MPTAPACKLIIWERATAFPSFLFDLVQLHELWGRSKIRLRKAMAFPQLIGLAGQPRIAQQQLSALCLDSVCTGVTLHDTHALCT